MYALSLIFSSQHVLIMPFLNKKTKVLCTHGGTRTPNLRFRRPTPYPLGHAGTVSKYKLDFYLNGNLSAAATQLIIFPPNYMQEASTGRNLPADKSTARLAQSVEHETLNLRVVGSSPTLGAIFFINLFIQRLPVVLTKLNHPGAVA